MSNQLFTFLGEPALVRKRTKKIIDTRVPKKDSFSFLSVYAEDGLTTLQSELLSVSMFAPARVFLVNKIEMANVDFLDFLLSYVLELASSSQNTLIITGRNLPKKGPVRKLKKALQKNGTYEEFSAQKIDMAAFLREACAKNLSLSTKAQNILLQKVGGDLLALENEIEKLICYADGKTITDRDVEELVASIAEASVWDLTDALVSKNVEKAMTTLELLLEQSHAPHKILSMILWQMRRLIELQDSIQQNKRLPKSWARVPERKRNRAKQTLRRSPIEVHKIFARLHQANRAFNSSKAGDRPNLELLVLQLCGL